MLSRSLDVSDVFGEVKTSIVILLLFKLHPPEANPWTYTTSLLDKLFIVIVDVGEEAPWDTPLTKNSYNTAPLALNITSSPEHIEESASEEVSVVFGIGLIK